MAFKKLVTSPRGAGTGTTLADGGDIINANFDAILIPRRSQNLFDRSTAIIGYNTPSTGSTLVPNADFFSTALIPAKPSTQYTWSPSTAIKYALFFDQSGTYIGHASGTTGVTSVANTAFIQTCARISEWSPDAFMLVEGAVLPAEYEWYHGYDIERIDSKGRPDGYAELDSAGHVLLDRIPTEVSPNLFDPDAAVIGKAVNNSGALVDNADFFATDYIEVEEGVTYTHTPPTDGLGKNYAFYDAGKSFIAGSRIASMGQFIAPAGARYVLGCARFAQNPVATFMLVEGDTLPEYYQAYRGKTLERIGNKNKPRGYAGLDAGGFLDRSIIPDINASPLKGKVIVGLGDSITYGFIPRNYEGYPGQLQSYLPLIAADFEASYTNYGISGSTVGDNGHDPVQNSPFTQRYSAMRDDADLVIVMGGTNDCRKSVPLGAFGDTTDLTYYGALDVLCKGLLQKYRYTPGTTVGATKKIMFMTALKLLKASTSDGLDDLLPAYNQAVKEVCAFYSIPVFDAYNLSGLTPHLFRTLQGTETGFTDMYNPYQTDGTHPTIEGNQIFAKAVAGFIRTLY